MQWTFICAAVDISTSERICDCSSQLSHILSIFYFLSCLENVFFARDIRYASLTLLCILLSSIFDWNTTTTLSTHLTRSTRTTFDFWLFRVQQFCNFLHSYPKTNCAKWHKTQKHIRTFKLVPLIYLQITFKRRRWTWEIEQFSDFLSHVLWHPQLIFLEVKIIDLCKMHSREEETKIRKWIDCNFSFQLPPTPQNNTGKSSIFLFIHSQCQQRETISLGSSRSINVSWRRLTWEKWILFEENLYRRSTTTAKVRATTMSHRIWVHTIIITITFMPPPTILH